MNNLLIDAVKANDEDQVINLITNGVNINETDNCDMTPLHWAALEGLFEISAILIKHGANINAIDNLCGTPLHYASWSSTAVVKLLLDAGADIDAKNDIGEIALHHATFYGNIGMIEMLISYDSSIDVANNAGETPLYIAVQQNRFDAVALLIALHPIAAMHANVANLIKARFDTIDLATAITAARDSSALAFYRTVCFP